MLAPLPLSEDFKIWNRRWSAPYGPLFSNAIPRKYRLLPGLINLCGEFSFQPNSDTRAYEYPWVFENVGDEDSLRIVEIGGGLSGVQFVLDKMGHEVINIDPGMSARGKGWAIDGTKIGKLNRRFGTNVQLKNCFVEDANIPDESVDIVLSVSTIEHIPTDDIQTILHNVRRMLKPGGRFILTVDLFLDVVPFTDKATNKFGANIDLKWLVSQSELKLAYGRREELYGFEEFDCNKILEKQSEFLVANRYPVMAQTLVLEK